MSEESKTQKRKLETLRQEQEEALPPEEAEAVFGGEGVAEPSIDSADYYVKKHIGN